MRYFRTSNASRQWKAGGLTFTFETTDQVGGQWFGVLAVEEPAASILKAAGYPQVTEIDEAEYSAQKKKGELTAQLLQAVTLSTVAPAASGNCRSCGSHPYGVRKT